LVNVARAGLDELLLDYEDFLRQRGLKQWEKDDPEARRVREVGVKTDRTDPSDQKKRYSEWLDHRDPAVVANALICLIHQANYLLDRQIQGLERQFVEGGGYSERLAAARLENRRQANSHRTDPTDQTDRSDKAKTPAAPSCSACGKVMVLRTARKGSEAGSQFWAVRDILNAGRLCLCRIPIRAASVHA
jgi:restriction system protein